MGQRWVDENAPAARGITAADLYVEEDETVLIASQTGITTIVAGDFIGVDTTSYGGSVRTNVGVGWSTTFPLLKGVALDGLVIPATAAAGDRFVTLRIMRRGFHNAVNVATGGALGNTAVPSATAGRGTATAVGSTTVTQHTQGLPGTMLAAAASNLAPMLITCDKH